MRIMYTLFSKDFRGTENSFISFLLINGMDQDEILI